MSCKRSAPSQTLPQAKRQAIDFWILQSRAAHPTTEPIDERDRLLPPSPALPLTPRSLSLLPGEQVHLTQTSDDTAYFCEEKMPSQRGSDVSALSSMSITPDMPDFEDQLHHRGVQCADRDYKLDTEFPSDWKELEKIQSEARESPEPTPDEHKEYRNTVRTSTNEPSVMIKLVPKILKSAWEAQGNTAWEYDKSWTTHIPLPLRGCLKLAEPKPDQAIGWKSDHFTSVVDGPVINALSVRLTRNKIISYSSPCPGMFWPVVTVEGKGASGQLRIARLQMADNQHELCSIAGRAEFPYGQIMAITIIVTAESAEVNCHWISKATDGVLTFWSRLLDNWSLNSPQEELYLKMRRTIRNSVEWIRAKTSENIRQDLHALRLRLAGATPAYTPSGSSRRQKTSEGQSREQLSTVAASRLSLTESIDADNASQSSSKSSRSSRSKESTHTTATTSSASRRRKQTPSMLVDPEGKSRRGHPPPQ